MKLLFLNSVYPKEIECQLKKDAEGRLQVAVNVFQWAVIEGLEQNNIDYTLGCTPALPAWPKYKHLISPRGCLIVNGHNRGHYLSFCTMPLLNQITRKIKLKRYARKWCLDNKHEDHLVIISYTQQADQLGAALELKKKYSNLIVAPIVTDLIENAMDFSSNRKFLKRIQIKIENKIEHCFFHKVDKFILLTRQMTDCIPEAKDRYIVMEGISAIENISQNDHFVKRDDVRTLFYSGTLEEFSGIRMLVDAFIQTKDPRFRLILCGNGILAKYIKEASIKDSRIQYLGSVDHEEVLLLQRKSTLLINPRIPNGGITKYSFPSKTMEYMTSRTPMIGYHLEGIPEEYYDYMYSPNDLSQDSLTKCINSTLSLPITDLQEKADAAYAFIRDNKNCKEQVARIISYLIN